MAFMSIEERNELVDLVAQAVIDRIEERDRINGLANMVVTRVLQLQKEEAEQAATSNGKAKKTRKAKPVQETTNV